MKLQAPKGTKDILPDEIYKWHYVEKLFRDICNAYGYKEIRIPVFEYTELFQRGVGDSTDIVQKEMYTFNDKGGRSITLRPEGTAGTVRAYIEHGMASLPHPIKLFYEITAYRYEKMQKGRYREHNQFGVEIFGSKGPSSDVEVISILDLLFKKLGLKDIELNINSIGCPACRGKFIEKFRQHLESKIHMFCETCRTRYERNPLRILDCKEEKCKELVADAPSVLDNLCGECREHFEGLKKGLENLGINYNIDKNIVRGQDYYTKTVFEFVSKNVGTQGTICGGGRYDGLVEYCGGSPTPGMGFGLGVERLLMETESQGIVIPRPEGTDLYIATVGDIADKFADKLVYIIRAEGISAEKDHMGRSLKAQLKYADKIECKYSAVIGENEIKNNKIILRNMKTGEQTEMKIDCLVEFLKGGRSNG
ncbi:MAG TPA: histidine--tRNA ligase [Clostridiaceae bacterium]|jgi:histidyl-tRNA synthetase|nr:histidine--tRNA ligase [Clostridiaceae bacterium]